MNKILKKLDKVQRVGKYYIPKDFGDVKRVGLYN